MKTILLGLNEINFHFIEKYIQKGRLPHFKKLFEQYGYRKTDSENEYRLLEPWIQWVTVHTGKTYAEHQIFRLGDMVERPDILQIFEELENKGYRVGAVSPFNADNRLKNPAFFVPDPWTKTRASGHALLKELSAAVSAAVNDNAKKKLSLKTMIVLVAGLAYYTPIKDYLWYFKKLLKIKNVATRPVILDKLLSDVFIKEWKITQPDFSLLFLNSGAHLQHHYMYNSEVYEGSLHNPEWYCSAKQDPIYEIFSLYDKILGELLALPDIRLILATGLSQQPHNAMTFYWRLKDHAVFLNKIGITDFSALHPRMSRDFLVEFPSIEQAQQATKQLEACHASDGTAIFSVDNRGKSLFVELVYDKDISPDMSIMSADKTIEHFLNDVAFVALKNGEHNRVGYYLDTAQLINTPAISDPFPLTQVHALILKGFETRG